MSSSWEAQVTVLNRFPTGEVWVITGFFISAVNRQFCMSGSTAEPYTQWLKRVKAKMQRTPSGRDLGNIQVSQLPCEQA